jgi:hypothetical protein
MMFRAYEGGPSREVKIFTGKEIEHTPAHGRQTLFVVGVHDASKLISLANEHGCSHVYLGANHSFKPKTVDSIDAWESMAKRLLDANLLVTLDFDASYVEVVLEMMLAERINFIPVISVKVPYADQLGYNACIKVDDKDFGATNHGVWVHQLRALQSKDAFTDWSSYGQDVIIE